MPSESHTYLVYFSLETPELDPPNSLVCLLVTEESLGGLTAVIGTGTGPLCGGPAAGLVGTQLPKCASLRVLELAARARIREWELQRGVTPHC